LGRPLERARGSPSSCGPSPPWRLKGGLIVAAPMGDPNAWTPPPQPVHSRMMFGALGGARHETSFTFLSKSASERGIATQLGLKKRTHVVSGIRKLTKRSMIHNDYLPVIDVDSQTYEVRADGQLLTCEPADVLPLAQRYFLF